MASQYLDLVTEVQSYLQVCNATIDKNGRSFPFAQIWAAIKESAGDDCFDIDIIDRAPIMSCRIRIDDDHLVLESVGKPDPCCGGCGQGNGKGNGKGRHLPLAALRRVAQNPDYYIANPAMIDWDAVWGG